MRILFVEDDPGFQKLSSTVARRAGHECVLVETVAGARALLQQDSFDLLALDLELPDGDGLEVCQQALCDFHRDVPMVIITGNKRDQLEQGCQELGLALIEKGPEFAPTFRNLLERLETSVANAQS